MSKIEEYKHKKRKAERASVEKADGGFVVTTHYPGRTNDPGNGEYQEPEKSNDKNLSSVHRHLNDCMGMKGK